MLRRRRLRSRLGLQSLERRDVPSTTLLKDINAPAQFSSYPDGGCILGSYYYFSAADQDHGRELWRTDGTTAGTVLAFDINPGNAGSYPDHFIALNGELLFSANSGNGDGSELWSYDLYSGQVSEVKDVNTGSNSSSLDDMTLVGNTVYFTAYTSATGGELWKTDGTSGGTSLVKDINDNPNGGAPYNLTNFNGTLYFGHQNSATGSELYKTDGTAAGTVLVKDIYSGSGSGSPSSLAVLNGKLYFAADNGVSGYELWSTDGTAAGTALVKDINVGANGSSPTFLTVVNNVLYFRANTASNGYELWRSDGTVFGTVSVKDIDPGAGSSLPARFTNVNGTLYFTADDGVTGEELWKSDGTAAGTVLVKDINTGASDSKPGGLTSVNGTLYFTTSSSGLPSAIWKTDGTSTGTVVVKDFFSTAAFVVPIGTLGGSVLWSAQGSLSQGTELWITSNVRRVDQLVIGADVGQMPQVRVYDRLTQAVEMNLFAYAPAFTGGVRVAVGDVTGDGVDDIVTAPGAGGGPHIRVFDGVTGTVKKEFFAYAPSFTGGVFVAVGDFNNDGFVDIVTGAGAGGGPHVRVFDGKNLSLITEFFAFAPTFLGGVNVGTGDINGDGYADLAFAAGPGGGPHVRVISGKDKVTELRSFFAFDASFNGGVNVAAGDLNGDGYDDLVVSQATKGGMIRTFNARDNAMINEIAATGNASYAGGVRIAVADNNHDGYADVFSYGNFTDHTVVLCRVSGSPNTFSGGLSSYDPGFLGGVFVGA